MKGIGIVVAGVVLALASVVGANDTQVQGMGARETQVFVEAIVAELEARGFKPATEFRLCREIGNREKCSRKRLVAYPASN